MDVALTITKDVPTRFPTTAAISVAEDLLLTSVQLHLEIEAVVQQRQLITSKELLPAVLHSPIPLPMIVLYVVIFLFFLVFFCSFAAEEGGRREAEESLFLSSILSNFRSLILFFYSFVSFFSFLSFIQDFSHF